MEYFSFYPKAPTIHPIILRRLPDILSDLLCRSINCIANALTKCPALSITVIVLEKAVWLDFSVWYLINPLLCMFDFFQINSKFNRDLIIIINDFIISFPTQIMAVLESAFLVRQNISAVCTIFKKGRPLISPI